MDSSKPSPQKSVASTPWEPSTILGIGQVADGFRCIGHTKQQKPCENLIKKDNRTRAGHLLLTMSTISPASKASNDFEDELKELGDILFCWIHRKDTEQVKCVTDKWTRAIKEFVRKSGDEVMGEADDTISSLDASISGLMDNISDMMERRLRLVQEGEGTQVKSERRSAGSK